MWFWRALFMCLEPAVLWWQSVSRSACSVCDFNVVTTTSNVVDAACLLCNVTWFHLKNTQVLLWLANHIPWLCAYSRKSAQQRQDWIPSSWKLRPLRWPSMSIWILWLLLGNSLNKENASPAVRRNGSRMKGFFVAARRVIAYVDK